MKYALLFPGQGSQAVGMLAKHAPADLEPTYREASEVLGWDVLKLVQEGPVEELNRTERTQPVLLAASIAVWRLWEKKASVMPVAMAGHSLGEYSALVAAGSLKFADALKLVELRGQLMQAAVPAGTGGMAAVLGLDDDKIEALCKQYPGSEVLEPVNYNSPGQVVVAGQTAALDWLQANGKANGAKLIKRLPVSVPSHCSLMRGAADQLAEQLDKTDIVAPQIPVFHNLDAQSRSTAAEIRDALRAQLFMPVRWTQTVRSLASGGAGAFFECGPGSVLTGLNKRIVEGVQSAALEDAAAFESALSLAAA
jgi:[acyl-carrier-protein] S-malonyltransferase